MVDLLGNVVTSFATIICAYIAYRSNRDAKVAKKDAAQAERRNQRKLQESRLSLKLMNANCALTVGTALAIQRGKANGELEEGLKQVAEAQKEYMDFMQNIALEDFVDGNN